MNFELNTKWIIIDTSNVNIVNDIELVAYGSAAHKPRRGRSRKEKIVQNCLDQSEQVNGKQRSERSNNKFVRRGARK